MEYHLTNRFWKFSNISNTNLDYICPDLVRDNSNIYYFSDFELDLLREELDHSVPTPAGHDVDISEGEEDELRRQR